MEDRRRARSYLPFGLMILLFLVAAVVGVCLTDFGSAIQAVNYFLVIISLVFDILLYSFCFFGLTWDRREKHLFELTVYLSFLFVLLTLRKTSANTGRSCGSTPCGSIRSPICSPRPTGSCSGSFSGRGFNIGSIESCMRAFAMPTSPSIVW